MELRKPYLSDEFLCGQIWIPACAGMTGFNNLPYHNTVAVDCGAPRQFAESNGFSVGFAREIKAELTWYRGLTKIGTRRRSRRQY
ncbi:hypothetical protein, partial [Neisseria meningitidis]|uniref:hypothetical protein n=1 Tax=Neisseria meningitidis TaxID=487 RepID=UPI001C8F78A9